MELILNITRALAMAQELPFLIALPIYGIAYAAFVWVAAKAIKAVRDAFK